MSRFEPARFKKAFVGSGVAHVIVLAAGIWLSAGEADTTPRMRVYAVDLYSPPPQVEGLPSLGSGIVEPDPEVEPAVEPEEPEKPEPEPPKPTPAPTPPKPAPAAPQRPAPRPETPRPAATEPRSAPAEQPRGRSTGTPSSGPQADPNSPGGENINVKLEGFRCPSDNYCNNIVLQINRYFRNPGGSGGVAEVYFVIRRDGSISPNFRLERSSSGSAAFRLAVLEAVERAGRDKAFGALPPAFQTDELPVIMTFRPAR